MGSFLSSLSSPSTSSSADDLISASLKSSQLIHRHTLSTCYDPLFDVSFSSTNHSILVSDDGRLRLFQIDVEKNHQVIELTTSTTKLLVHDLVQDIAWSTELNQFLVLTTKHLATFDYENNFVKLDLQYEKGSPPFWRMACWSSHLMINLGLGASIRYHRLDSSSLACVHSWSRSSLDYEASDLLSCLAMSPQLILAINVELENNRHVIDLFSLSDSNQLIRLQRIDSNQPCPLDVITSLRNYTWLCKSHWPSDDCLCLIESDGQVKKVPIEEQNGYILNIRLTEDRSYFVLVRTANKLPKESDLIELETIKEQQQWSGKQKRQTSGKLPPNLLLEIYRVPSELK